MTSTASDLQARYAILTERIGALNRDLALAQDREQRATLQIRLEELERERDQIAAEMTIQGVTPRADGHIEHRVTALEREVRWIKGVIKPGTRQTFAKVMFYGLLVTALVLWVKPETFAWLIAHPFQALLITLALGIAALIIRWLPEAEDHDQR